MNAYIFPALTTSYQRAVRNNKMPPNVSCDNIVKDPHVEAVDETIKKVSSFLNVQVEEIMGRSRKRLPTKARQLAIYFMLRRRGATLESVGRQFSRDHSTISYSRDTVIDLAETDKQYRSELELLANKLKVSLIT